MISRVGATSGGSPANQRADLGARPTEPVADHKTKNTPPPSAVADPFGNRASSYVAGREGAVTAAAYDITTKQTWTFGGPAPQDEASIVKVAIIEALLAGSHGQQLSSSEQTLSQNMLEMSDNDAATSLWEMVGASPGIQSFDSSVGLTKTTPSTCVECPGFPWPGWGLSTTTPLDQLTLLRLLVQPNAVLSSQERVYALNLMENVTASEVWGVSGGVPSGDPGTEERMAAAQLNRHRLADQQYRMGVWGRSELPLAVLTTGNPSEQYGIDTIDQLSSMVWAAAQLEAAARAGSTDSRQVVLRRDGIPQGRERHLVLGCLLVGRRRGLVIRVGGVIRRAATRGLVVRPAGVVVVHSCRCLPRIGQILDHRGGNVDAPERVDSCVMSCWREPRHYRSPDHPGPDWNRTT